MHASQSSWRKARGSARVAWSGTSVSFSGSEGPTRRSPGGGGLVQVDRFVLISTTSAGSTSSERRADCLAPGGFEGRSRWISGTQSPCSRAYSMSSRSRSRPGPSVLNTSTTEPMNRPGREGSGTLRTSTSMRVAHARPATSRFGGGAWPGAVAGRRTRRGSWPASEWARSSRGREGGSDRITGSPPTSGPCPQSGTWPVCQGTASPSAKRRGTVRKGGVRVAARSCGSTGRSLAASFL